MSLSSDLLVAMHQKSTYLRCGEFQYFRVRQSLWRSSLRHLREAHFNAVATYVPWILHEARESEFDFEGRAGEYTNLIAFLETCREEGFPVMIRPGPQIYAEFDGFGIPRWLGSQYSECVMRGPNGRPVKGPFYYYYSLLHPTYLAKVEAWYKAVTGLLWPRFADTILSFQLDNETGMIFANTIGNFDFNADTVNHFREYLRDYYEGDVAQLRAAWNDPSIIFETIAPPRRRTNMAQASDWYAFLEKFMERYLRALRDIATRCGVPVPFAINDLDMYLSPVAPRTKRGVASIQGYDIYTKGSGTPSTTDFPFSSSHAPERFRALIGADSSFIAIEMGAGWFDPRARVKPEATVQATLGGIAHGLQGHSFYVVHDGHNPNGSPYSFHSLFTAEGQPTERFRAVAAMHEFTEAYEAEILTSQPLRSNILFLSYQPYARLMPGDYLPGRWLPDPLLFLEALGLNGFYDLLLTCGFTPTYADLESISPEELDNTQVACFPSRGWMDNESLTKLTRYVEQGGRLITFPYGVTRDEHGYPIAAARNLYPYAESHRHIGYWAVARKIVVDMLGKYLLGERRRLRRLEPTAMHATDAFEGLKVLLNEKLPAAPLATPDGMPLRGDYVVTTFSYPTQSQGPDETSSHTLLTEQGRCAGYETPLGAGTSVVLGSLLAGAYTTGVYYQLTPDERGALRKYASELMLRLGAEPNWTSTLDIECMLRRTNSGSILAFIFNRLDRQQGIIRLAPHIGDVNHVMVLWTYSGSSAILARAHELEVTLEPDDVLIIELSSRS